MLSLYWKMKENYEEMVILKHLRQITVSLVFVLMFSFTTSAFAGSGMTPVQNLEGLKLEDYKDFKDISTRIEDYGNITEEHLDPNYYTGDEIISIPEEYLDPYHPEALYTTYNAYGNSENGEVETYAIAAAAGIYWIPGIGQIALTATGVVVVAGATFVAGSWVYNQVAAFFAGKAFNKAKKNGTKTSNHSTQSTSTKTSLSTTGKALSSKDLKDSQGVKQRRYYDKNGKANLDIDFRHAGKFKFPHRHTWSNGKRSGH